MVSSKVLTILAVIVVVASIFSVGIVYLSARTLFTSISGYVTSIAEANLSVESVALINFTTFSINWGSGRVTAGHSHAYLTTLETNNVTNGNWTLQTSGGLRLQNQGNTNVSLNITGTKTAAQFIGGTSPAYTWNVSNFEANSCLNATGGADALPLGIYRTVNITQAAQFCARFQFVDAADTIRIDFNLTVPSDSLTGALGDTITAIAFAL